MVYLTFPWLSNRYFINVCRHPRSDRHKGCVLTACSTSIWHIVYLLPPFCLPQWVSALICETKRSDLKWKWVLIIFHIGGHWMQFTLSNASKDCEHMTGSLQMSDWFYQTEKAVCSYTPASLNICVYIFYRSIIFFYLISPKTSIPSAGTGS